MLAIPKSLTHTHTYIYIYIYIYTYIHTHTHTMMYQSNTTELYYVYYCIRAACFDSYKIIFRGLKMIL